MRRIGNPDPPITENQIEKILSAVRESGFSRVHYIGCAEKSLILALTAEFGVSNVSLMDMEDRWSCDAAAFWDEDDHGGMEAPIRPDWLDGIRTYFDGTPHHQTLLRDYPWDSPAAFDRIVESDFRAPPRMVVFWGHAHFVDQDGGIRPFDGRHPFYKWDFVDGLMIGKIKDSVETQYERECKDSSVKVRTRHWTAALATDGA